MPEQAFHILMKGKNTEIVLRGGENRDMMMDQRVRCIGRGSGIDGIEGKALGMRGDMR